MALRDKLVDRSRPYLEADEQIYAVMMAQSGPSPYWIFLTWLTMLWNKYLIVVVTDRSIVTLRASAFKPSFVKQPPDVVSYQLRLLGPCSGLWGKIKIEGETFHVHKRFHKDVTAGNSFVASLGVAAPQAAAAQAGMPAAPVGGAVEAGWYPDPNGEPTRRYWDGTTWTDNTA